MIRVRRPEAVPARLLREGAQETASVCAAVDAGTTKSPTFKSAIYAHDSVRSSLFAAQHGKCAFCEQRITAAHYGDVEHFRPKGGWQQARGDGLKQPGYYWLAYAWSNLLISCRECNSARHKGTLFPLENGSARALSHHDDVSKEHPLFIDPASEEPADSIRFREHMPYAPGDNPRGVTTIRELGLGRPPLRERRRDAYERLKALATIARTHTDNSLRERARAVLLRWAQASAEFSAMARDFIVAEGKIAT